MKAFNDLADFSTDEIKALLELAARLDKYPEPEALRDPIGNAQAVQAPVVRTHREQVADVLVRDGARADRRVPHRGGLTEHR